MLGVPLVVAEGPGGSAAGKFSAAPSDWSSTTLGKETFGFEQG
jgi:hypothetical protein